MYEVALIRVFVGLSMLAIASYFDLRYREVDDLLWIIFGAAGLFLYFFDAPDFSMFTFLWVGLGFFVVFLCWLLRMFGQADAFAMITISVILPSYESVPTVPIVLIFSVSVAALYVISSNFYKNLRSLVTDGKLFVGIDEPPHKKLAAFFIIHKKSANEHHSFCAESTKNGRRGFVFRHDPDSLEFSDAEYVVTPTPMMPFFLFGLALFVAFFLF